MTRDVTSSIWKQQQCNKSQTKAKSISTTKTTTPLGVIIGTAVAPISITI